MRVTEYRLRDHSGGDGAFRGGDGLVREISFEVPTEVTLLTERRSRPPYGLQGVEPGKCGENRLQREGKEATLPGKLHFLASPGDRLPILSPRGEASGKPTHNHPYELRKV